MSGEAASGQSGRLTALTQTPCVDLRGKVYTEDVNETGAQFTKYLTIYRKIIVRSTYDSDLKRAKTSFRNIVS